MLVHSEDMWQQALINHHHNGRANLKTSLSTQFYDSRLGFVVPYKDTFLNVLKHQFAIQKVKDQDI